MINAITQEIALSASLAAESEKHIETIYFGGGTPSLLHNHEIGDLLSAVRTNYLVSKNAEITIEANPDDISAEILTGWLASGINRLSIGVQSFKEADLLWMNRAHNSGQAMKCLDMIADAGFANYSADLIYGSPGLSDSEWESHLALMIQKNVPHLACYALTVEPKTPLAKLIRLNKSPDVDSDAQARQFLLLMKWMRDAGYEHYEISNFAKPGMRSKHNSNYWHCGTYTGMGPSAHSYDGEIRKWNVSNNALYIQSITNNKIPFEAEVLTLRQCLNEYIMTSLRTIEGLDLDKIHRDYSDAKCMELKKKSQKFIDRKLMVADQHRLILNDEGKLFADGIAADLFFDE